MKPAEPTPMQSCPVCDGSGEMPAAMRGVIYRPDMPRPVGCWICYGEGQVEQDRDIPAIWTLHKVEGGS